MRFITETPKEGEKFTIVLTGDGEWERKVLLALSRKLDGKHVLWRPKPPKSELGRRILVSKGIRALIGSVRRICLIFSNILRERRKLSFLLLFDKEHIKKRVYERKKLSDIIAQELTSQAALQVESIDELRHDAVAITARDVSGRNFKIYIVAMGRTRCLDENLAYLIKLVKGIDVKPDKRSIMRTLRSLKSNIERLIEEAGFRKLCEAIPELIAILEKISEATNDNYFS